MPEKILSQLGVELSHSPVAPQTEVEEALADSQEETDDESGLFNLNQIAEDDLDFSKQKEMFEKEFIIKALKTFKGRVNQTALHANIPKKTLLRKMEKYNINAKDYTGSN